MPKLRHSLRLSFLLGWGWVAGPSHAAPTVDDSVRNVAGASLHRFVSAIPVGEEGSYGFEGRDELDGVTLGVPVRVYGTSASMGDSLLETRDSTWNRPRALDVWRVPVQVRGRVRALLTVERIGGRLRAVDLGAASLARELGRFDSTHARGRRALLRVESRRCDVLMLDRTGKGFDDAEFHPLRSARPWFDPDSGRGWSREQVFRALRDRSLPRSESAR